MSLSILFITKKLSMSIADIMCIVHQRILRYLGYKFSGPKPQSWAIQLYKILKDVKIIKYWLLKKLETGLSDGQPCLGPTVSEVSLLASSQMPAFCRARAGLRLAFSIQRRFCAQHTCFNLFCKEFLSTVF